VTRLSKHQGDHRGGQNIKVTIEVHCNVQRRGSLNIHLIDVSTEHLAQATHSVKTPSLGRGVQRRAAINIR
jgi:hypothetical protein